MYRFHVHSSFLSYSPRKRKGGHCVPFPEPLGVKEHLPWMFGSGSAGMLSSPIGRIPLRRGSEPLDKPEGRRLLSRMDVDMASAVQGVGAKVDFWGQFSFPFLFCVPLSCLSVSTTHCPVECLICALTSGDTKGALHMDTEAHVPGNFVVGGRPSSMMDRHLVEALFGGLSNLPAFTRPHAPPSLPHKQALSGFEV